MGEFWGVVYRDDLAAAADEQLLPGSDGELVIRHLTDKEVRLYLTLCTFRSRRDQYIERSDAELAKLCGYRVGERPDGRTRYKGLRQALKVLELAELIEVRWGPGFRRIYFKDPRGMFRTPVNRSV